MAVDTEVFHGSGQAVNASLKIFGGLQDGFLVRIRKWRQLFFNGTRCKLR